MPDNQTENEGVGTVTKPEWEELLAAAEVRALREDGYLTEDGLRDVGKIDDVLLARVLRANVTSRRDRESVAVTRAALMREVFPHLPGPGSFDEEDDPPVAAATWALLDEYLWRRLSPMHNGVIQRRLEGENVVLCRTQATPEKNWAVYVTRDWGCMLADFTTPDGLGIARRVRQMGRNVAMAAERVPEHATKLRRELQQTTRDALGTASVAIDNMIETAKQDGDPAGGDSGE